jgi:hypothetical protein
MVDYEATPERGEVNVVILSVDYYIVEDGSAAAMFNFPIQDATFKKPKHPINHLKPLHMKGHINGTLVHDMLVDNGAIVNVKPYLIYKLGGTDEELVRTNMMITSVGGGAPILARGIANMELIGSKTLATAFFVVDVQGSYSLILRRDWIHANCCVPSSLHQFLIQWVDEAVEIVYLDSSTDVATADAPMLRGMMLLVSCLVEIFLTFSLLVLLDKVVLFMYLCSQVIIGSISSCNHLLMDTNIEWLKYHVDQYRANKTDACEAIDDFDELDKLGQGFTSANPLEQVDIRDGFVPRPMFINQNLEDNYKAKLITLLREYVDCFAWNYTEMSGLS